MSPRYLGGENKRAGEAIAVTISELPNLLKLSYIYLVARSKAVLYSGHHTLCTCQPGCLVLTSVSSVTRPAHPTFIWACGEEHHCLTSTGSRAGAGAGRARVERKMGASAGRQSRTAILPCCSSLEPPASGMGPADRAAGIVPESDDNNSNHNGGS